MKTIKKWLCKWLGIKGFELKVNKFIDDNNGQILDRFGLLEDKIRKLKDSNLGETIDKLIDDLHLLKSKQKCDMKASISHIEDIKDNERRIDRLEQCIYGLSISDDVKATDIKAYVKDMAHQMYGEHQARQSVDEDITTDDVPF